jgi:hypothetical protein
VAYLFAPPADLDEVIEGDLQAKLLMDLAQTPLDPFPGGIVPSDADVPKARPRVFGLRTTL